MTGSTKVLPLSDDLIEGADNIAVFMFGSRSVQNRRKVYNLTERNKLPTFRLGATIYGRKSVILQWIEDQERRSTTA